MEGGPKSSIKKWICINNQNDECLFLSYDHKEQSHFFNLTNFIQIWATEFSTEELIKNIQENNPLIECDSNIMLSFCLDPIFNEKHEMLEKKISHDDSKSTFTVAIKVKRDNFPVCLCLTLTEDKTKLFSEIIQPLLSSLKEAYKNQDHLVNLICKKDTEIEEYKAGGAILSLKHLETKKFDAKEFLQNNHELFPKSILNTICKDVDNSEETTSSTIEKQIKIESNLPEKSTLDCKVEPCTGLSNTQLFSSGIKRNSSKLEPRSTSKRKPNPF